MLLPLLILELMLTEPFLGKVQGIIIQTWKEYIYICIVEHNTLNSMLVAMSDSAILFKKKRFLDAAVCAARKSRKFHRDEMVCTKTRRHLMNSKEKRVKFETPPS